MNIYTVEHYTINPNWTLRPIRLSRAPYQYKPRDALYTSPLGSEYSWAQWCKEEATS